MPLEYKRELNVLRYRIALCKLEEQSILCNLLDRGDICNFQWKRIYDKFADLIITEYFLIILKSLNIVLIIKISHLFLSHYKKLQDVMF